jgi:hypothetical protein
MENEKQIVLFFKGGSEFNELQIAAKINERHPSLNNPITIPYDESNPNNPLIVFNKGLMNITVNRKDASFIFKDKDNKECLEIINDIIEIFEENDIEFIRLGYISTHGHTKKDKEKFLKKLFVNPELISDEFNLAWYKSELIDSVRVNVWERHLTDMINKADFVSIIDINTPMDKEYNITSDFVIDFINKCDKYIDKKLDERF